MAACVKRVERGAEQPDDFHAVAAIGHATSDDVSEKLRSFGAGRAALVDVYSWLVQHENGMRRLIKASSGDLEEQAAIRDALNVERTQGREEDVDVADPPEDASVPAAVKSGSSGGSRRESGWGGEDRARSYARDEPAVKAAAAAKHHVYVKSGGLTFEIDKLRRPEEGRLFTVRVEGAQGKEGKSYDWLNKVTVQLTAEELHQAAAVVLGMSESMTATHHGDARDKRLELRREKGHILVRLTKTGLAVTVPVDSDHLYKVALVFVRALTLNDPDVDSRLLLDTLRLTSAVVRQS